MPNILYEIYQFFCLHKREKEKEKKKLKILSFWLKLAPPNPQNLMQNEANNHHIIIVLHFIFRGTLKLIEIFYCVRLSHKT